MTQEDDVEDQALLQRIAKLLALADSARNSSEAEAALAAAKVQELLQMHGLSLAEVEAAGGKSDDGGRGKQTVRRSSMYAWQRRLMETLAECNFCVHRLHRERNEQTGRLSQVHQLIGRRINVAGSQMIYDYLVTTMKRLVSEAGYAPGRYTEKDYHVWLEGCTVRLCERLKEQALEARRADEERKAKAAAAGSGRDLVVLDDVYGTERDLNNDVLCGYPPGTTAQNRRDTQRRMDEQSAVHKKLMEEGVPDIEAWYRAYGYGAEEAKKMAADYAKDEKAPRRQRRQRRSRGSSWTRADQQEYEKRNSAAWRQGSSAGNDIGLSPQMKRQDRKGIK